MNDPTPGISGFYYNLPQARVLGPGPIPIFHGIGTYVLGPVARPLDHHRTTDPAGRRPVLPAIAFLPSYQAQRRIGQHLLENLLTENSPVDHPTEHALSRPLHDLTATLDHAEKALAYGLINKVVGRFKVKRLPSHRVDEVAVHRFVRPPDGRTPPFQHVLLPGVMLGVRVEVKLVLRLSPDLLRIEAGQRFDIGLGGDPFQLLALGVREAHHGAQQS